MPAAATILYKEFRNTLTHALGKDAASDFREAGFDQPTVGPWGKIKPKRIGAVDARKSWPGKWPILQVWEDNSGKRDKLTVAALYWAVKDLVKKMVRDAS
jgi:hypothetical protein